MKKTCIVVPCYNEEKRLNAEAFLHALDTWPNLSFLFVNDGSRDGTLKLLNAIREKNPERIEVLSLEMNSGKAEAVRRGMLAAVEGGFDNAGYWDADLATPLEEIPRFCNLLETTEAELIIGSRIRLLGRKIERQAMRHYLGRIFATFASIMLQIGVYDTQCGAKIFKNGPYLKTVFGKPFKVKWTFDVEMLGRFPVVMNTSPAVSSSHWFEYPLQEWVDVKGSKVTPKDFIKGGLEYALLFYLLRTPALAGYRAYLQE